MIKNIIELLALYDSKEANEIIDVAKGKYKFPETFKELKNKIRG
jgi:hypothetical protein